MRIDMNKKHFQASRVFFYYFPFSTVNEHEYVWKYFSPIYFTAFQFLELCRLRPLDFSAVSKLGNILLILLKSHKSAQSIRSWRQVNFFFTCTIDVERWLPITEYCFIWLSDKHVCFYSFNGKIYSAINGTISSLIVNIAYSISPTHSCR